MRGNEREGEGRRGKEREGEGTDGTRKEEERRRGGDVCGGGECGEVERV